MISEDIDHPWSQPAISEYLDHATNLAAISEDLDYLESLRSTSETDTSFWESACDQQRSDHSAISEGLHHPWSQSAISKGQIILRVSMRSA